MEFNYSALRRGDDDHDDDDGDDNDDDDDDNDDGDDDNDDDDDDDDGVQLFSAKVSGWNKEDKSSMDKWPSPQPTKPKKKQSRNGWPSMKKTESPTKDKWTTPQPSKTKKQWPTPIP